MIEASAAPWGWRGRALGWAGGLGDGTKGVQRPAFGAGVWGLRRSPKKCAGQRPARRFSEQFFGARLAQRVADRPGRVLAFAILTDARIGHGRAVLALQ